MFITITGTAFVGWIIGTAAVAYLAGVLVGYRGRK